MIKIIGVLIIGLGVGFVMENILRPKNYSDLMKEYEIAKMKGEKPSKESAFWHSCEFFFKLGLLLTALGGVILLVGYLLDR